MADSLHISNNISAGLAKSGYSIRNAGFIHPDSPKFFDLFVSCEYSIKRRCRCWISEAAEMIGGDKPSSLIAFSTPKS
jgi:hypothetical protein